MEQIVVTLCANILKFLMRALEWYQESKLKHLLHSITRPPELRYKDLLTTISSLSHNMAETARICSYAEQRDMHSTLDQSAKSIRRLFERIENIETELFNLNTTVMINTRQNIPENHLKRLVNDTAVVTIPDPIKAWRTSLFLASRSMKSTYKIQFWLDPKIQQWNQCSESSLVIIMLRTYT